VVEKGENRNLEKKAVSGMMLTLFLIGMSTLAFKIQPVKAEPKTWTVDDDGPADFHTIQEAINAASPGDTIFVYNGTYCENVVVNKTLMLIGENPRTTVIDGEGITYVIRIRANDCVLDGFSIINSNCSEGYGYSGVAVGSSGNIIKNNIVLNNLWGIVVGKSDNIVMNNRILSNKGSGVGLIGSNNTLIDNHIASNDDFGIVLEWGAKNNTIMGNNITDNKYDGIYALAYADNNVIANNTISFNVYCGIYLKYDNRYNIIANNRVFKNGFGIALGGSYNIVTNNALLETRWGMGLFYCSGNTLTNNLISNNEVGIEFMGSSQNILHHNDFIRNTQQVLLQYPSINIWDDDYPSGGNYWSDYTGVDLYSGPYQNETGSDGIGDTPYVIDANNRDRYPLMNPLTPIVHDVAILNVVPSSAEVHVGQVVNITVTVKNEGNTTETFTVTCKYELEGLEYLIGIQTINNLAPDANTTLTFNWTTTDITVHTIKAEATILINETDVDDNTLTSPITVKVKISGDVNNDNTVNILDCLIASSAFGSYPGHPRWNTQADINQDNKVDILDIILIAKNFGKTYP